MNKQSNASKTSEPAKYLARNVKDECNQYVLTRATENTLKKNIEVNIKLIVPSLNGQLDDDNVLILFRNGLARQYIFEWFYCFL